jgi:urease accessory protein
MSLRLADTTLVPGAEAAFPKRQRSQGRVALSVARFGDSTRVVRVGEAGPLRARMPRQAGAGLEAVLVNTGGGIACGDEFSIEIEAGEGSDLVLSTAAAEKIYRSDGPVTVIDVRLSLGPGASLAWLPQETILYDRARLRRSFEVAMAADARLSMFESIVFGRNAHNEQVTAGSLEDRWRIRREGKLVFGDTLRLAGPVASLLDRPAVGGGARALANFLYVAPDAEARLEEARALLIGAPCSCGASAWRGLLAVRFLSPDIARLRRAAIDFLTRFRGESMPRAWQT